MVVSGSPYNPPGSARTISGIFPANWGMDYATYHLLGEPASQPLMSGFQLLSFQVLRCHDGMTRNSHFFLSFERISLGYQTPWVWRYDWTPKPYLKHRYSGGIWKTRVSILLDFITVDRNQAVREVHPPSICIAFR